MDQGQEVDLEALASTEPCVLPQQMPPVLDLAQSRAMLKSLGARPPHQMVEAAQAALARIEAHLSRQLAALSSASAPPGRDNSSWNVEQAILESDAREAAEKEKLPYKSIIQLDELHSTYEDMVKRAESAVVAKYEAHQNSYRLHEVTESNTEGDVSILIDLQEAFERKKEELVLSGRGLEHLPESCGRIYTLRILDLSCNRLETLPDAMAGLINLSTLKVQSNLLKTLPDSIGLLKNLKILDISSNRLATLPESITRCGGLLELHANFNQMMFLPSKFGYSLQNMEKLSLHYNNLSVLPNSICELKSLKYLDVHFNKLRALPAAIGQLRSLEVLDVSSNFSDLTSIPESIGDLVSLVELNLSFNQIRELPASLGRLDKLKVLQVDENPLVDPPVDVVSHGHSAVMEYMVMKWNNSLEEASESSVAANHKAAVDSAWIPAKMTDWVGGIAGSIHEYVMGPSPRSFGRTSRRSEDYFEQL